MDKYEVIWTEKAIEDLSQCINFVLLVSREAAFELGDSFKKIEEELSCFPERNPIFEMPKAFPFVIRKYIIKERYIVLYAVDNAKVILYRVLDARRKFDQLLR